MRWAGLILTQYPESTLFFHCAPPTYLTDFHLETVRSLAGAIANCTRVGERVELNAIGAGSVNQAIKAIAIARQYVEEEAIDLCFRPGFVEIMGSQLGEAGTTSALRLVVLVEQC